MVRYLCISWDRSNSEQRGLANRLIHRMTLNVSDWTHALAQPGLVVLVRTDPGENSRMIKLPADRGVLLGTAFQVSGTQAGCEPDSRVTPGSFVLTAHGEPDIAATMAKIWGSYVLITVDSGCAVQVVRSPVGKLPCFYSVIDGVFVAFSDLQDLSALSATRLTVDWDSIAAQCANRDYLTRETAIREIRSLEPGESACLAASGPTVSTLWSPNEISRGGEIADFEEASRLLRCKTRVCVNSWAAEHDSILHMLGGLDSSVVLSCLAQAPRAKEITCVHQFSVQPAGDERQYVRSMAQLTGVRLIETEHDPHLDLRCIANCALTARPVLHFTGADSYRTMVGNARRAGATAIFNGELGDQLYGSAAGVEFVAEHLWRVGLRPSIIPITLDYAMLKRMSFWRVLRTALRDTGDGRRRSYWSMYDYICRVRASDPMEKGLIAKDALMHYRQHLDRFVHPWLQDIEGVPPGRFLLIYSLMAVTSTSYHEPFAQPDDPPIVSPLASQPLVDGALRISSPLHIRGGTDRAVARHAFRSQLSPLVLARKGKGAPSGWIQEVVRSNTAFIEEFLLDGLLVRERILDRRKTELTLRGTPQRHEASVTEIMLQLYIEAWLRKISTLRAACVARTTSHQSGSAA